MRYTIKQFQDKVFTDKMDLVRFMRKNYDDLLGLKKLEYKTKSEPKINDLLLGKSFMPTIESITNDIIEIKAVVNTTNIIDSHMDLHMDKIWNKTVMDNPFTHHLKQHEQKFESVISGKARQYNETMNFLQLGLNKDFATTANINHFTIDKKKDPFMFDKYANGEVLEHSVGMSYVSLDLAYYDEDSQKNMDFFELAKSMAVNPEIADENGYVWVVYEAKKREGSAVVFGSNSVTPTLSVKNYEPLTSTLNKAKPSFDTLDKGEMVKPLIDYTFLTNNYNK
jgi:hypothetical protein